MKTKLAALFIVGLSVWLPATQAQNTSEPAAPVDLENIRTSCNIRIMHTMHERAQP